MRVIMRGGGFGFEALCFALCESAVEIGALVQLVHSSLSEKSTFTNANFFLNDLHF